MMEIHQDYEADKVTIRFDRVLDYATNYRLDPQMSVSVVLSARDFETLGGLMLRRPDSSARAASLERELVRTKADLLTARKDLAEFNRELHAERDAWAVERIQYEGTLRAMEDIDTGLRNEIRELKDLIVRQALRLTELAKGEGA
ncbi:hypothetical protein [Streptomyces lydicus]|uniref:hypothetical protein n=1 Tax=Streptomyces lydicus TaxID=47763 RepID=UPI0037AAE65C